jgi:diguanylate cyclase (GGDEF)-like protein
MPHFKYLHRSSFIKDALLLIAVNFILLIIYASFDIFEKVLHFVEKYEYLELDELLPLSASLTISLLFFTYRRMVELGQVSQAFEQLAKHDPLTQVLNRRAGYALLDAFYQKAEKNQSNITENTFSILQLDLDNFKRINDLYGANVGDDILVNATRIIHRNLPQRAELIHWHSDNFLIILPKSLLNQNTFPFEFANKVRNFIKEELFKADPITCSIGITTWQLGNSLEDMLHEVEDALLDAKAKNKDTVCVA